MIGSIIHGRYRIDGDLGQGGMGTVYRAHDLLLDRDVAVKVLSAAGLGSQGHARLLNEAQAAAKLHHPNIVTIFDAGTVDQAPFIVMELVDGRSLHESHPNTIAQTISVARQILIALDHAHSNGIIHRDLKPENVLVTESGVIKLMDFGLARSIASRLSIEGAIVGTVFYMAPEMALGQPYDGRVDLYALGVMLYEFTAGRLPFTADDPISIISQHLYAPIVPPSTYNPELPTELEAIILQLLIKEPNERPANAEEVLKAFEILSAPVILPQREAINESSLFQEPSLLNRLARGHLVGREREFSEARSLWKRAASGSSQILLLSGEPGIGKTRLAREIITLVEVSSGQALVGECYAEGGAPYAPVAQVVRQALTAGLAAMQNTTPHQLQEPLALPVLVLSDLIQLAPDLAAHFPSVQPNPPLDPLSEQQRLYESLYTMCATLSARMPLLLVIEDAHWADSGSLRILRHLMRRSAASGLSMMLLLTYREIELDRAFPLKELLLDLNRERLGNRLKLTRLSLESTHELLAALLQEQIDHGLTDIIYHETEGNPFFIEEVCKSLVEQGDLVLENGHWQISGDMCCFEIPQSVRLAIQSRADQLQSITQEILLVAAVIGREFDFQTLRLASAVDEDQLIECLEEAEKAQLVQELKSRPGEEHFSFTHALVPSTLREGVSGVRLHRLHRRAAEAIERLDPENYPALAYHCDQSGDEACALMNYRKAAENAQRIYANDEALYYYSQALEFAPKDTKEAFELHAGRMHVHELIGRRAEQKADIEAMLGLADKLDDPLCRLIAQLAQIDYDFVMAPLSAIHTARQAVQGARQLGEPRWEGQALFRYGEAERILSNLAEARQAFEEAAERFQQAGLPAEQAKCYHTLALVYVTAGDLAAGQEYAEKALVLSRIARDRKQEATSLRRLGLIHLEQDRPSQAESLLREALSINQAVGDRNDECHALIILADILIRQNQIAAAEQTARQTLELGASIRSFMVVSRAIGQLDDLYRHRGQYEAVLHFADEMRERFKQENNLLLNSNLLAMQIDILVSMGQYERALDLSHSIQELLETFDSEPTWSDIFTFIAWIQMNLGRLELARELLNQAHLKAVRSGIPLILGINLQMFGELALRLGEENELLSGISQVLNSIEIFKSLHDDRRLASAYSTGAQIYLALSQPDQALEHSTLAVQAGEASTLAIGSEVFLYTHALVLHANRQNELAREFLHRAKARLDLIAEQTNDPDLRNSWFDQVAINRSIIYAWDEWGGVSR